MTATTDAHGGLRAATRRVARSGIGFVMGSFAGPQTVVHATGPVSVDSVFQIGSVTNVFTSLALADAVARGELTLDILLTATLPEKPTPTTGRRGGYR